MKKQLKKVLVLGSGALKIGQAGEFDYSCLLYTSDAADDANWV